MKARYLFPKDYMADPSATCLTASSISIPPTIGIAESALMMTVDISR